MHGSDWEPGTIAYDVDSLRENVWCSDWDRSKQEAIRWQINKEVKYTTRKPQLMFGGQELEQGREKGNTQENLVAMKPTGSTWTVDHQAGPAIDMIL